MDYEKAYNEIVQRARELHEAGSALTKKQMEIVCPELTESEDERIRKEIIEFAKNLKGWVESGRTTIAIRQDDIDMCDRWIAYLEKQKEQIPFADSDIKPHKGDDNNPYDMRLYEAQEYAIKRGFGIPFNDGEVYVDERHMTQTIGNILRWADEHPKEQKPAEWSEEDEKIIQSLILEVDKYVFFAGIKTNKIVSFLKSLRPQPKQECSACPENIKGYINGRNDALREMSDFINSRETPPQPHWKPTEEQMEALKECGECKLCIKQLYEQLKKL